MKKAAVLAVIMLFVLSGSIIITMVPSTSAQSDTREHPNGWTHRPLMEHFTGLSCGPCMRGAHPDATRLWQEEGYSEGGPWNYIEFHELNGGGEDDLMTLDSRDRMYFYSTGTAGTPFLEIDGGYVELGGKSPNGEANYDDMQQGLSDSGERDEIKKVNVAVGTIYDGSKFTIKVDIDYIQNDEPYFPDPQDPQLPDDTLRGTLYVFMIEDYVTAYSTILESDVTVHNNFREYAIEDFQFELQPGDDTLTKYAEWEVPDTMIREEDDDGNPIIEPIRVPINPSNVRPLAVVYDLDDRESGRGDASSNTDGDGGDGSPRLLNSATPENSAWDSGNNPPEITLLDPSSKSGKLQINAQISDDGGELSAAYVIYREHGKNDSQWKYKELTIDGEECTDDVCTIGSGEAYAVLSISDSKQVEYSIMAYDGNWTRGNSEMSIAKVSSSEDEGIPILLVGGAIAVLAVLGAILYIMNSRNQPDEDVEVLDDWTMDDEIEADTHEPTHDKGAEDSGPPE